jgi:ubiquinol-cytochrome c reductase iron-sulfur subunit
VTGKRRIPSLLGRPAGTVPAPIDREIPENPTAERLAGLAFVAALLAGIGLLVVYVLGGQTQIEAVLLMVCLGGIGLGIVVWAQALLPNTPVTETRHPLGSADGAGQPGDALAAPAITRRTMLVRLMFGAFAGLAAALAVPVFSLGPAPGRELFVTPWRKGLRLVDETNMAVSSAQIPVGGLLTVFPEGYPGSADGQALLINVGPGRLQLPPDRAGWAPNGFVAYSKVCTHAGCPVGLYRATLESLICPCHQSTFDVLRGAIPTGGPAVRPLPQLPITLQPDGTFAALGDFPEPVGPSFWNIHSGG